MRSLFFATLLCWLHSYYTKFLGQSQDKFNTIKKGKPDVTPAFLESCLGDLFFGPPKFSHKHRGLIALNVKDPKPNKVHRAGAPRSRLKKLLSLISVLQMMTEKRKLVLEHSYVTSDLIQLWSRLRASAERACHSRKFVLRQKLPGFGCYTSVLVTAHTTSGIGGCWLVGKISSQFRLDPT